MLFLTSDEIVILTAFVLVIALAIVMFIIGIFVTRWYARKKEWSDSLLTAFIVNLIWLLTNIPVSMLVDFLFGANFLFGLVELVIAIIIGAIVVKILYKKEFGESFVFVIVVQIVLFLIAIIIGVVLGILIAIILVALLLTI